MFPDKQTALKASSIKLNRAVGEKSSWTKKSVTTRTETLVQMALKVFVP